MVLLSRFYYHGAVPVAAQGDALLDALGCF